MKNGNKTDAEIFRSIFEGATDFVYTTDLRGAFTDVNKAAVRLTGYRKKQLIGMNFKDYIPPADQKKIRDAFLGILKTGKPIQDFPLTVTVKDGSKKQFETSAGLRKEGKRIVGFQGISRDVTEQIRSESKLQLLHELVDRSPDYISLINLNSGHFTYVNNSLC